MQGCSWLSPWGPRECLCVCARGFLPEWCKIGAWMLPCHWQSFLGEVWAATAGLWRCLSGAGECVQCFSSGGRGLRSKGGAEQLQGSSRKGKRHGNNSVLPDPVPLISSPCCSLQVRPHHTHTTSHSTCPACRNKSARSKLPAFGALSGSQEFLQWLGWTEAAVAAALVRALVLAWL